MFLIDKSSILLIDGYLSTGKILYSSPNFPILFGYNSKDILNFNIDDLLPNVIQSFHKEVMEEAIKYSNIEYKFKKTINSLLKNKNGGICKIKLFIKTVPNLNFGLIYYAYLQKEFQSNFLIIADKELKINGFSEMVDEGSSFTMGLGYNLSHSLYGHHIGLIIPDILPLLVYQNDEFHFLKKDLELKGYLYQVNDLMKIKSKVDIILNKIKNNKNNNQPQYED
jgi:PAS domain S-box-containing protein